MAHGAAKIIPATAIVRHRGGTHRIANFFVPLARLVAVVLSRSPMTQKQFDVLHQAIGRGRKD